jgi:hypothetical protein
MASLTLIFLSSFSSPIAAQAKMNWSACRVLTVVMDSKVESVQTPIRIN